MIRMTKKTIGLISGSSAVIIASSTVLANVALKTEKTTKKDINPLRPSNKYHHYSLLSKIRSNTKLKDLIDVVKDEKQITYIINENKFLNIFKSIVQDALKATSAFSQDYLNYRIECNYCFDQKTRSIRTDLVWYKPENKTMFYDQFIMQLQTT